MRVSSARQPRRAALTLPDVAVQRLAARVEDLAQGGPEVALRDGSTVMSSHEDYTYHLDPASGELLRAAGAAGGELRQLDTNQRAPGLFLVL